MTTQHVSKNLPKLIACIAIMFLSTFLILGCGSSSGDGDNQQVSDTNTATDSSTNTATDTPTDTATDTPTDTATDTPTDTATDTPTDTATDTPTDTATDTPTDTPTDTATDTPTDTATDTEPESPWAALVGSYNLVGFSIVILGVPVTENTPGLPAWSGSLTISSEGHVSMTTLNEGRDPMVLDLDILNVEGDSVQFQAQGCVDYMSISLSGNSLTLNLPAGLCQGQLPNAPADASTFRYERIGNSALALQSFGGPEVPQADPADPLAGLLDFIDMCRETVE